MQKPYRGDYKPDYEKWKQIGIKEGKGSFIVFYIIAMIAVSITAFFLSYNFNLINDWKSFNFISDVLVSPYFYISSFIVATIYKIFDKFDNKTIINEEKYIILAENEAEKLYQEDLDRWYHYLNAEDEVEDRRLARDLKRKRAMGQIDDERLIYQYSQLQAIQYQTNQQAVEFFQQAQQALRDNRKSDLDYSLDQLERALGV